MITTILVDILYILIIVGITAFTRYGLPYITSKVNEVKDDSLRVFIEDAIQYAENQLDGSGNGKFSYVLDVATTWCVQHGMNISTEQLKILIEGIFNSLDIAGFVNQHKKEA